MKFIKKFFGDLIRPDAKATFINYIISIFLNPVIILFVPIFITENQQGYWYTFGSVAALTTFADLGFTSIMTQYVAHEYTYLALEKQKKRFCGDTSKIERISSLFRFVIKWMSVVLLIATIIILTVGYFIFRSKDDGVYWELPWFLYVIACIYYFSSQVLISFYEGCDQFDTTQIIRAIAGLSHCLLTIFLLFKGCGLYALALPLFLKGTIIYVAICHKYGPSLKQLLQIRINCYIPWWKEFVPLLGKYAVSWISGYFAAQIYNPLTFSLYGATAAGKVGYSLSLIQAIYTVANVWSLISMPKYNMHVEKKEWGNMDKLLIRNILYSALMYVLAIIALSITIFIPPLEKILWTRVLPFKSVIVLSFSYFIAMIIYAMSVYLRAHKKEPFMIISIISGVLSALLTFLLTRLWGLSYIFVGLMISEMIVLPLGVYILSDCRKKWHKEEVLNS